MSIKVTTAPTAEPVTLDEAKRQCRIELDDDSEDSLLNMWIEAARLEVEDITKRALITQTITWTLDRFPSSSAVFRVPRPPLVSVTSVKYYDTAGTQQTVSSSNYIVDTNSEPGRIAPAVDQIWPTEQERIDAVEVIYVAGYGARAAVPTRFKAAILMSVCFWWENRGDVAVEIPQAARQLALNAGYGFYAGQAAFAGGAA